MDLGGEGSGVSPGEPNLSPGRLATNVWVADGWWGPDYGNHDQVPAHVAELITNPDVWEQPDEAQDDDPPPRRANKAKAAHKAKAAPRPAQAD